MIEAISEPLQWRGRGKPFLFQRDCRRFSFTGKYGTWDQIHQDLMKASPIAVLTSTSLTSFSSERLGISTCPLYFTPVFEVPADSKELIKVWFNFTFPIANSDRFGIPKTQRMTMYKYLPNLVEKKTNFLYADSIFFFSLIHIHFVFIFNFLECNGICSWAKTEQQTYLSKPV